MKQTIFVKGPKLPDTPYTSPRYRLLCEFADQPLDPGVFRMALSQMCENRHDFVQLRRDLCVLASGNDRRYMLMFYGSMESLSVMIVVYVPEAEKDDILLTLHYKTKLVRNGSGRKGSGLWDFGVQLLDPATKQTDYINDYLDDPLAKPAEKPPAKVKPRESYWKAKVRVGDVVYPSIQEAAKAHGVVPATVVNRCGNPMPKYSNWSFVYENRFSTQ